MTPSVLADQVYTLTDSVYSYKLPPFTVDNVACPIVYSYTISDPIAASTISFD